MLLFLEPATWASELPVPAVLLGLTMLVCGAELLVRGAVWIALTLGMSRMAVGLTLVSIGTSLPELLVTLSAADGHPDMAMGNVLGSNIANLLLIVGTTAAIRAVHLKSRWLELGFLLVLTALVALAFVRGGRLERWQGVILLAVLAGFLLRLLARERRHRKLLREAPPPPATATGWLGHAAMLAAGFTTLAYGADWLVEGASRIAQDLGMSDAVVGVTVVAIGTSLPELATSLVAALRGQAEICVGNVVGSNIFNIGAVLGGAGILHPFAFDDAEQLPVFVVATGATVLLVACLRLLAGVPRALGFAFLIGYAGFTAYMVCNCQGAS
ncbi:MAG TPA: sodium:calcium antiporter [bacterium]|nr:sodium:calcium antiporter [bacterium]